VSGLETRRLHALAREEAVDGFTMNAEHASNAYRVEPAVVDQAADGLRVDAELVRHLPDTDQTWFSTDGRHNSCEDSQVSRNPAWAERTKKTGLWGLARLAANG
jgi:hypothetical protein